MADDVLRLIQITDCHITKAPGETFAEVDPVAMLEAVLVRVRAEPAHAVLATGDLAADGSEAAYRRLKPLLSGLGAPVFVLPGNHDEPAEMRRTLTGGSVRAEGRWEWGRWRLLMLDSTVPGLEAGRLGTDKLAALDRTLAAHTTRPVLIVLHHHPVVTGSGSDHCPLKDGAELLDVLDRHGHVKGVIWGHIHAAFDATRRGIRLMGTPSTARQFPCAPGTAAWIEPHPGYRRLSLHPDGRIETDVVWAPV